MAVYDENGFLGGLIQKWVESHQEHSLKSSLSLRN